MTLKIRTLNQDTGKILTIEDLKFMRLAYRISKLYQIITTKI